MPPTIVCVIPSRFGATRLPGKPLVKLLGRPMIQWVYEAARRVEAVSDVIVATDDARIRDAVKGFGGKAVMTPPECPSGTDRIQMAVAGMSADFVINIQGDEPAMRPATINTALVSLMEDSDCGVGTACVPIKDVEDLNQPHIVKVVRDEKQRALYFSRAPIASLARTTAAEAGEILGEGVIGYKHLGLYVYRRAALDAFVRMPQSKLERIEKLEQLRFLEAGYRISCPVTDYDSVGVDVAEDVPRAEEFLRRLTGN